MEDGSFEDESELLGQVIADKYQVDSLLGRGGMGTVWRARNLETRAVVAIKLIRAQFAQQEEARRRFEIEAIAASQLTSPHAARVYDYGETLGRPFIAMEYLEGESLSETIARSGPLALGELAALVEQASHALAEAHSKGIIHRDLKPDNVFLATNVGNQDSRLSYHVQLVDFGIAKMVIGTPTFMSPEQLTEGGAPDVLMDVWALGVTAYTAATGRLPFEGEVMGDLVLKVCTLPMPIPSRHNRNLTEEFDAWFARACARNRQDRFQTIQELSASLSGFADPGIRESTVLRLQKRQIAPSEFPKPHAATSGISPKVAVALGVILGVSLLLALLGIMAWRSQVELENAPDSGASTSPR
jgi:eukaryotic-like serine/threonine-protein kinase